MPRTQLMLRRNIESAAAMAAPVVCPAGEAVAETLHGPASRCRLEQSVIAVASDVSSYRAYCCAEFTKCPTWREARHVELANRDPMRMLDEQGVEQALRGDDLNALEGMEVEGDYIGADRLRGEVRERRRELRGEGD